MPRNNDELVRAFNDGCDARLKGKSLYDNPNDQGSPKHTHWRWGWQHTDSQWGKDALWSVKALPKVVEG